MKSAVKAPKSPVVSAIPEGLVSLLALVDSVSAVIAKPSLTPSEKRSVRKQLPMLEKLLIKFRGDILDWFGGDDVYDGIMEVLRDAEKKLGAKK